LRFTSVSRLRGAALIVMLLFAARPASSQGLREEHGGHSSVHRNPGTLLWEDQLDQARRFDAAIAVAARDGTTVIAGETTDASFNTDILVRAYASRSGTLLWQTRFDLAGYIDEPQAVAINDDVVVVGGYGTT